MPKSQKITNTQLIRKFQEGDNEAFDEIVKRTHKYVFRLALKFLRSIEDAEDLTQEVFIKLYNYLPNFEFRSDLKTYLYKMVINAAAGYYKKDDKLKEKFHILAQQESQEMIDDKIVKEKIMEDLENAIKNLPKKYKEIILLRDFQELSYKEISEKLNISKNAAKMRHFYALKLLKARLLDTG